MPRYKVTIEYDGSPYAGWQQQSGVPTVQEEMQKALFAFSGENNQVTGSGRTDAGVHALAQVAHFDCEKVMTEYAIAQAFNAYLRPQPISVVKAQIVPDTFHARFDALERSYVYTILNRRSRPALLLNRAWWVAVPLNVDAMKETAEIFIGKHDFTTFRAIECQAKSPVRTLDTFEITSSQDLIHFTLSSRSFLHHQVRNLVGTLKMVGEGLWDKARVVDALKSKDRKKGGPTAPPEGLYFQSVQYGDSVTHKHI